MQELEKTLEEIEQRKARAEKLIVKPPHDKLDQIANDTAEAFIEAYKECQDIIRKHMNDGWIPVEERLPEEAGTYIVTAVENNLVHVTFAKWRNRYKRFDMTGARAYWRIIAWRPLPEPYKPKQPETHKYTICSCCWSIDQCSDCPNNPERSDSHDK